MAAVVHVPGDKSISHRALLLASVAEGESRISRLNTGTDVRDTAAALVRCGISMSVDGETLRVTGSRLSSPAVELDFGNSGTGVRLAAGLLAGSGVHATLTGDDSLRGRPMDRIVAPLRAMGADVRAEGRGRFLPLIVSPATLHPLSYELPVASAQVKSSLLLAALAAGVAVELTEPVPTRDHTERMLRVMGASIEVEGTRVHLDSGKPLRPLTLTVPGDFSSAAFLLGLATLVPGVAVELPHVGVNPGRTGLLPLLSAMGADVRTFGHAEAAGEPIADLSARYAGRLRAVAVAPAEIPSLIDELPLLAVLAATAAGTTVFRGASELRVKESDRIATLARGLDAVGVAVRERADGLEIDGRTGPFVGAVDTAGDHRIAMAFAVLGKTPGADVRLSETASIASSFPEFPALLHRLAAGGAAPVMHRESLS